ncbi:uncharacterized protein IWZ02DRAFT_260193 [Phyllosticta citriasiana]|uniref:uncharacterized protein n=1 Tax=Phyllosticta citriasiana TaxID=595635 RepID=UPI0030FD997F
MDLRLARAGARNSDLDNLVNGDGKKGKGISNQSPYGGAGNLEKVNGIQEKSLVHRRVDPDWRLRPWNIELPSCRSPSAARPAAQQTGPSSDPGAQDKRQKRTDGQTDRRTDGQTDVRTARAAESCGSGPSAWSRRLVMPIVMTTRPLGGRFRGSGTSLPSSHSSLGPWAWCGVRGHGLVMTAERRWRSSWRAVVQCGGEMVAQDGQSRWMRRRRREDRGRGEVRYRVLR